MRKILFGIITLLALSCSEKPKDEFSLNGKTNELKDGTFLYLEVDNDIIDSTEINNNSFVFNTKLSHFPLQVILRTNDFSQYRFLWLENNKMTFDATISDFKNAKVTGSETERSSTILRQKIDTIPRSKRHKYRIEFISENPDKLFSSYLLSFYATTWVE